MTTQRSLTFWISLSWMLYKSMSIAWSHCSTGVKINKLSIWEHNHGNNDCSSSLKHNYKIEYQNQQIVSVDSVEIKFGLETWPSTSWTPILPSFQTLLQARKAPHNQHPTLLSFQISISLVQSLSRVQLFVTPWTIARQTSLSFTNSQSLLKLMPIESMMPSNPLILYHPLLLLPSIFPSIRVFSSEFFASGDQIIGAASVFPVNIQDSFPLGWTGLISLQSKGLSKESFPNQSSKASVIWCSAFFMVQLSHPYITSL